jgi:serine/threonine-protein kinase
VAALAVGFGLFYGIRMLLESFSTTVVVPQVEGLTQKEAEDKLSRVGLNVVILFTNSNEWEEGLVINQVPKAGETVQKENESVQVLISKGVLKQEMPALTGSSYSDAVTLLKSMGMTNVYNERVVSQQTPDLVVATVPRAGEYIDPGTTITLSVSGGETVVPDLYLMGLPEAEQYVLDSMLTFDPVLQFEDTEDESFQGLVAAQNPEPDSHVTLEKPVSLRLYRSEKAVRRVNLDISVPGSEQELSVRVTLQAPGSSVEWTILTLSCPPGQERTTPVTVEIPDGRGYVCTVYTGNEMSQRIEIGGI